MKPLLLIAVAILAAIYGFSEPADAGLKTANARSLALVGKPAPDFTLPDLAGQAFHLADQHGKVVVLAFWATWCPPCRAEIPALVRMQKEFPAEAVTVAAIAVDNPAKARSFLEKKKLSLWSLVDANHAMIGRYGANYLPRSFVIGSDGTVLKTFLNKLNEDELRAAIESARH